MPDNQVVASGNKYLCICVTCAAGVITAKTMSSSRLAELEERAALLIEEVAGLRQENSVVDRLRQENGKLQERNLQLAAELAVSTRELEVAAAESGINNRRQNWV